MENKESDKTSQIVETTSEAFEKIRVGAKSPNQVRKQFGLNSLPNKEANESLKIFNEA